MLRYDPLAIGAFVLVVSSSAIAQSAPAASRPPRATVQARVDSIVAAFLTNDGPSGISIAVTRGRDTLVMKGWGVANRETNTPATPETSYRIASTTKQFTAALVLRLAERGQLALDDSIGRYLPQLPVTWRAPTIAQLLNHTAGLPRDGSAGEFVSERLSPDSIIALDRKDAVLFAPGEQWAYSNVGYFVLGMLVEKLYARSYAQVIDQELATPLGLTHTRFCEDAPGANGQALSYIRLTPDADFTRPTVTYDLSHAFSAGGLCSTVGDLAAWARALHGGQVVNAASYSLMTTPQGAAIKANYGFGLIVGALGSHRSIGHGGDLPGFYSDMDWFPDDSVAVVVMINTWTHAGLSDERTARVALGLPVSMPVARPTLDEAALSRYAGQYAVRMGDRTRVLRVWTELGRLMAQLDLDPAFPLRPAAEHAFDTTRDATTTLKFAVENGNASGVVLQQGGRTLTGVKSR